MCCKCNVAGQAEAKDMLGEKKAGIGHAIYGAPRVMDQAEAVNPDSVSHSDRMLFEKLVAILRCHVGESGVNEGALDCLNRIIGERDDAKSRLRFLKQTIRDLNC